MKRKQSIALLLLAAMLATTACGGSSGNSGNDTDTQPSDDTVVEDQGYDFQGKDFNEYEFNILNLDVQYGCYVRVDFEEQTGEQLDEAVYKRNRFVEEQLNFNFNEIILERGSEWNTGQQAICDAVMQEVMSDSDDYDAAYLPIFFKPEVVTGGYLVDLLTVPEMKVMDEYWDVTVNDELVMDNKLFVASGPLNFMTLDLCWLYLFNETMMDNLKLEYPYDLVREGKWTLDKLNEYISAAANLNGDENFTFTEEGSCVYGMSAHTALYITQAYAANNRLYYKDADDNMVLTLESDRFYTTLEKIAKMFTIADGKVYYKNEDLPDISGYVGVFSIDRALFLDCQLKAAQAIRHMESSYGMVPQAKLDETQEDYSVNVGDSAGLLAIDVTQDDISRAGFILDALTYESHKSVLPVYMDVTVSQKGMRNDDSIEMLQYIWEKRTIDVSGLYKITKDFNNAIGALVTAGTGDVSTASSLVATHQVSAEQKLVEFLDALSYGSIEP